VGAALAIPAMLYGGVIKPYVGTIVAARSAVATHRDLLERERAVLVQAPATHGEITEARNVLARADRRLYQDRDPIVATAALSRDVGAALEDAGVQMQRAEAREVVLRRDGLRELTLDLRAEGDLDGILAAIATLEAGDRLIRVSRLAIERSGISPVANGGAEALTVSATVHAYAR
jgi:hypothetical protein